MFYVKFNATYLVSHNYVIRLHLRAYRPGFMEILTRLVYVLVFGGGWVLGTGAFELGQVRGQGWVGRVDSELSSRHHRLGHSITHRVIFDFVHICINNTNSALTRRSVNQQLPTVARAMQSQSSTPTRVYIV